MAKKFGSITYTLSLVLGIIFFISYWQNGFSAPEVLKSHGFRIPSPSKLASLERGIVPRFRRNFEPFAKYDPQSIKDTSGYVFCTFFCSAHDDPLETSFIAVQSLIWRILWSDWHSQHPFVVFVCPSVSADRRKMLQGQGADVKELQFVADLPQDSRLSQEILNQYSLLNIWAQTKYKRIAFLNITSFPLRNIDDIFDSVSEQTCHKDRLSSEDIKELEQAGSELASRFCKYVTGGVDPFGTGGLNAGVMVLTPNDLLHRKLLRDAKRTDKYEFTRGVQGLLESQVTFHSDGPFPAHHLPMTYNAVGDFYLKNRLEIGDKVTRVVQEKLWSPIAVKDRIELSEHWDTEWMAMCRWYDGHHYPLTRETGYLKTKEDIYMEDISGKAT